MKKFIIKLTIAGFISFCSLSAFATTNPPDPGGSPGTGPALGGSAPIGGGLGILLVLGAAYGGKKVYNFFSGEKESIES